MYSCISHKTPLRKTEITKVKGLKPKAWILPQKFKISRGTDDPGYHVYHTKNPFGKRELRRWRGYNPLGKLGLRRWRDYKLKREYYHKNSDFRVGSSCHVTMNTTKIARLENGDYKGEGTINWNGNTTTKTQNFAWDHLVMLPCVPQKSPPWKTGTTMVNG